MTARIPGTWLVQLDGVCPRNVKGKMVAQDEAKANEDTAGHDYGHRLRVTDRQPSEHIDGAWWPSSTDLVTELPALLAALSPRLGTVVMVGYVRNGWTGTSPTAEISGHVVELLGFDSTEPATVIVVGHDGHHLTLRVVPPAMSEPAARRTLDAIPERSTGHPVSSQAVARSVADVAHRLALHEGRGQDQRDAEIMRWCEETAAQFNQARIQTFVPILVEHIVRNRMSQDRPATKSPQQ